MNEPLPQFRQNPVASVYSQMGIDMPSNVGTGKWEDLMKMQRDIGETLVSISQEIAIGIRQCVAAGIDSPEAKIQFSGVRKDLESFLVKAANLFNRHRDRTGVVPKGIEYSTYMAIGMDYYQLQQDINTTLWTPMLVLTEYIGDAVKVLRLRDTDVVSDVEIKTPQTTQ